MSKFVSLDALRKDLDTAMAGVGYVRIKVKCDEWGITPAKYANLVRNNVIKEDSVTIHTVKYISKDTPRPEGI